MALTISWSRFNGFLEETVQRLKRTDGVASSSLNRGVNKIRAKARESFARTIRRLDSRQAFKRIWIACPLDRYLRRRFINLTQVFNR